MFTLRQTQACSLLNYLPTGLKVRAKSSESNLLKKNLVPEQRPWKWLIKPYSMWESTRASSDCNKFFNKIRKNKFSISTVCFFPKI